MRRITGNKLWKKSDPKGIVVAVWSRLEEFLTQEGYTFTTDNFDPLLYTLSCKIDKYNGECTEEYTEKGFSQEAREFLKRIAIDLSESRSRFIGRIERFGCDETTLERSLDGNMPTIVTSHPKNISLAYRGQDGYCVAFDISPGKYAPSYDSYVGVFSTSRERDKDRQFVDRITDASQLIVNFSADTVEIEKRVQQLYRQVRRNLK